MDFGIQFFPDIGPEIQSAEDYWDEALRLVDHFDELGYSHVRTVEHYFESYGGYTPNPHLFLVAASQRTKKARLVTGAVLPVFNHPLKIAGEIGVVDAISHGRMECGFARAFLPHEFTRFGISVNESKARFDEGYNIMGIPMAGGKMKELLGIYRESWKAAGHPGNGKVMLAFHMFCHPDADEAREICKPRLEAYLKSLVDAASDWTSGASSADYPGYDKIIEGISKETFESQVEKGAAWIGTPDQIRQQIADYQEVSGGFEVASLQVNFNTISYDQALTSMRLFSKEVMPDFVGQAEAAE
mgnify:CR=1 FL=1